MQMSAACYGGAQSRVLLSGFRSLAGSLLFPGKPEELDRFLNPVFKAAHKRRSVLMRRELWSRRGAFARAPSNLGRFRIRANFARGAWLPGPWFQSPRTDPGRC